MADELPRELRDLLSATDPAARTGAWGRFLERYSQYLLGTAGFVCREYDARMDAYRYVLEELERDGFKRLREYSARPDSRFSTWLVVVVRRLCYDFLRKRYGRARPGSGEAAREGVRTRRRLQDLIAERLDHREVVDGASPDPERRIREGELSRALTAVLGELSSEERLLLKLRYEDGLPVRKVAEVLRASSEFVVYRKEKKILGRLREWLEEEGIHDPYP